MTRDLDDAGRWPRRVYASGSEPDPRFTLANERTLLAWLRTSLALVVAGIAAVGLSDYISPTWLAVVVAVAAFLAGGVGAVVGFMHWMQVERALRESKALPSNPMALGVVGVVVSLAILGVIGLLVGV